MAQGILENPSLMKPFGYPIPTADLMRFANPQSAEPLQFRGKHTYIPTPYFTLRTTQYVDGWENNDEADEYENKFIKFSFPGCSWVPLANISKLVNKYPCNLWKPNGEANPAPVLQLGASYALRSVIQLATMLPNADVCMSGHFGGGVGIRFKSGQLITYPIPLPYRDNAFCINHDPNRKWWER
jgi:hypothetical protein